MSNASEPSAIPLRGDVQRLLNRIFSFSGVRGMVFVPSAVEARFFCQHLYVALFHSFNNTYTYSFSTYVFMFF